ncbi:hypothetical protein JW930_04010 [Candidatus Woesearchaeota archaeon]|nr:hypothetical protein [Candidatus Woesearchaeota archaeon]
MMQDLVSWTLLYVKNKDILQKKLLDYSVQDNALICNYTYGKHTYYIHKTLNESLINNLNNEYITLVCLNTKKNLLFVVKHWSKLIKYCKLSIVYANPEMNEKWVLHPYTHNRIADANSLKIGLQTMFESVQEVNE